MPLYALSLSVFFLAFVLTFLALPSPAAAARKPSSPLLSVGASASAGRQSHTHRRRPSTASKGNESAFMREANAEAAANLTSNEGGPFGAVIVKDGAIIGRGRNRVLSRHDPTCHAEIEAIRAACQALLTHDLSGCVLYTSCYPCPMCLSAAIWANIKTVYYGNTAQDAAAIGFRDDFIYRFIEKGQNDPSVLTLTQLDRDAAIKTFNSYREKPDKELY